MNQTYVIENLINNNNNDDAKKHKLKAKLGKLRERTQLLLQNHSWKKYFNNSNNFYLVSTSSSGDENIFRKNEIIEHDEQHQKSILMINTKSNSKLNSFQNNNNNILLTPIENYFLTNSNTHLNLFNETPIARVDQKRMCNLIFFLVEE